MAPEPGRCSPERRIMNWVRSAGTSFPPPLKMAVRGMRTPTGGKSRRKSAGETACPTIGNTALAVVAQAVPPAIFDFSQLLFRLRLGVRLFQSGEELYANQP